MTGDWECMTYEIQVKPEYERENKTLLTKLKDKVLGRKKEEKKGHPKVLNPLMKYVSTPSPVQRIVPGHIWITNKLKLKGEVLVKFLL